MIGNFNISFSNKEKKAGFSLIELSIVLVVIGILFSIVGTGMITYLDVANQKQTRNNLAIVTKALELFKEQRGRLPCPADLSKNISSDTDYGAEVTGCESTTCPTGLTCNNDVIIGAVPVTTLNIGDIVGLDGWDNKITYVVEKTQTSLNCKSNGQTISSIIINDPSGNPVTEPFCYLRTTGASSEFVYNTSSSSIPTTRLGAPAFLLISHGEDGSGATNKRGEASTCPTTGNDKENCDGDSTFIDYKPSYDTSSYFDDVLTWYHYEKYPICPEGIAGCLAWIDVADRCSIGLNASDQVLYIQDKLARSECATAPDGSAPSTSNMPSYTEDGYNGLPTITFGSNDYINYPNIALDSDNFEFYIVARPTENHEIDTQDASGTGGNSGQKYIFFPSGGTVDGTGLSLGENGVSVYEYNGTTFPPLAVHSESFGELTKVIRVVYTDKTPTIYVNGALAQTGDASVSSEIFLQLGQLGEGSQGFEGDFFEMIVYEGNLENHEANRIESYLMNKWRVY